VIYIEPREPGPEWNDWKKEADKETKILVESAASGKSLKFKSRIWKKLKPFLEDLFHKKCAYCEGIYEGGTWPDVEHYRPKAKVTFDRNQKNTVKITDSHGNSIDHPGYYWLSYDWRNLLLSCSKCNSGKGKMNQFPIAGKRACRREDSLDQEKPLLINPCKEKTPGDHITFGIKGTIIGKTEKGKATIKICNLDREELQTCRQREWEKSKVNLFLKLVSDGNEKIITDDMQYSAYLREAIMTFSKKLPQKIEEQI
jgi:hypothetical protein